MTIAQLRTRAAGCRECDLFRDATQTVFGTGAEHARVLLVGEQPGDREDRAGEPFVGPAGRLLDEALSDAGIDRDSLYITNAVKHFRFEERGKRRIHKRPNRGQIRACHPWLDAELATVAPEVVVCLGAVAAESLLGKDFRLTERRGERIEMDGRVYMATIHPSAVLRAKDRDEMYAGLVADLRAAAPSR